VTWALQMLEEHPEQRERLYQEVDAVLGGRQARWSDLPELGYTSRFLKETMRIYPGAWMVTRATSAEVELAGITLPAGATVVFSPLAVHHRADVYAEPERFDPDRWLPGSATALPRYAFTTFGGGARRCIGDNYTTSETALTLASIAASWRLIPGPGSDPTPTTATGSLRPEHLVLRLQHR
jgi:pentalenene oxygenase